MGSQLHYHDGTDLSLNFKRKTPSQLHQLQNFYSEDKYPTQKRLEYYACVLGLTYQQVRGWFVERRRKHKMDVGGRSGKGRPHLGVEFGAFPSTFGRRQWDSESSHGASQDGQVGFMTEGSEPFISDSPSAVHAPTRKRGMGKDLMTVWRFTNCDAARTKASKRRKVLSNSTSFPAKKHGMGKALMTVWKVMHPNAGKFHELSLSSDMRAASISQLPSCRLQKSTQHKRTRKQPVSLECNSNKNLRKTSRDKCELSIAVERCQVHLQAFASLVDDEELELREQRAGTDLPSCSSHFSTNEKHACCSLCKGLLAKFPPNFVRKKQPLLLQPWSSSGTLVKMLLKVQDFF
ncbi:Homeobox-DDT domain protein RLT3-like protein [Drosera capensis]